MATNVLGVGDPGVWAGGGCGGSYLPLSLSLAGMATNALGVGDQGVGGVCVGGPYLPLSLSLAGMATNVLGVGDPGVPFLLRSVAASCGSPWTDPGAFSFGDLGSKIQKKNPFDSCHNQNFSHYIIFNWYLTFLSITATRMDSN